MDAPVAHWIAPDFLEKTYHLQMDKDERREIEEKPHDSGDDDDDDDDDDDEDNNAVQTLKKHKCWVGEPRPEASYLSCLFPAPQTQDHSLKSLHSGTEHLFPKMMNADMDTVDAENQVDLEEKTRLINQVLELQHTLEDLSARVDAVKEENLKLKSENQVLGQYIENLMSASSVFQTTDTKSKRK
ncbi:short coiled-coil protein-like [Rattus rattus]|uniref:short coiled-coil protein-like n=1 Tax=Rattus rattus TaxID=10117 RepID=UPI0013F2CACE|nr:short coiled-coil protein-like [Rattus rattus]